MLSQPVSFGIRNFQLEKCWFGKFIIELKNSFASEIRRTVKSTEERQAYLDERIGPL